MKTPYPESLNHAKLVLAAEILKDCNYPSFVAGGLLRDTFYEIPSKDIDIYYIGGNSMKLYTWEKPEENVSWLRRMSVPETIGGSDYMGGFIKGVDRIKYRIARGKFGGDEIAVDLIGIDQDRFEKMFGIKLPVDKMYTGKCIVSTFPIGASQVFGYYSQNKDTLMFESTPFFQRDYDLIRHNCLNKDKENDSLSTFWYRGENQSHMKAYFHEQGIHYENPNFPFFSIKRKTKNNEYRHRVGKKLVTNVKPEFFIARER